MSDGGEAREAYDVAVRGQAFGPVVSQIARGDGKVDVFVGQIGAEVVHVLAELRDGHVFGVEDFVADDDAGPVFGVVFV